MDFVINAKPLKLFIPSKSSRFRYKIWELVNSTAFEYIILFFITVNTVILMMKWYNQPEDIRIILKHLNIAFTSLFAIECILKMIASGHTYFNDRSVILQLA
jgi:hypothetical protein